MKLIELHPRWVGLPGPIYDGLSFDCPHCRAQRIGIHFRPPIDPNGWWPKVNQPTYFGKNVWTRDSGDTFQNLTLMPSINTQITVAGHWHGFIINGEIR